MYIKIKLNLSENLRSLFDGKLLTNGGYYPRGDGLMHDLIPYIILGVIIGLIFFTDTDNFA